MKKKVKDAVEYFKGVWPSECRYLLSTYSGWVFLDFNDTLDIEYDFSCSKETFEQEVEMQKLEQANTDWYDYDKQEALYFAPDKTRCQVQLGEDWQEGLLVASHKDMAWFETEIGGFFFLPKERFRPLDWNRKQLEQEKIKHKTSHAAFKAFDDFDGNLLQSFEHLYDIGALRPVTEWSKQDDK